EKLANQYSGHPDCPGDSQVGTVTVISPAFGGASPPQPIYNLAHRPGTPAEFGFNVLEVVHLEASVRTGADYGLDVNSDDISQGLPLTGVSVTFWGVPADPS